MLAIAKPMPKAQGPIANVDDFVPDDSLADDFFDAATTPGRASVPSSSALPAEERYIRI